MTSSSNTEKARFGCGCFWGVQKKFNSVPGVIKTTVGYSNGFDEYKDPSYKQVCSGQTDHNEVIDIEYDPKKVSYSDLLKMFWKIHDPTQKDRQGPDVGRQYRSMIAYYNEQQKQEAEKSMQEHAKSVSRPIATVIEEAKTFYPAEEYHQNYLDKTGGVCYL